MSFVVPAASARPPGAATIEVIAGTGEKGYSGDGGPALKAQLNTPSGLVRGPDGALYLCDTANHAIRKITADGTISTIAGTGQAGYSGDGGPALKAQLREPWEVRFDSDGNMIFVERLNHIIRRIDKQSGLISTVAGTGKSGFSGDGGPATTAQLNEPHSLQLDAAGNIFFCDIANQRIRRIDKQTGVISTFCGTGKGGPTPDGAPIQGTPLNGPRAIDFDKEGNLWVVLRQGNAIYKLDLKAGTIHHMAGTGKKGFTGDGGPARQATFSGPKGISVGPDGNIYLADTENHAIRMIDLAKGTIDLVAGTGVKGSGPDGDPKKCPINRPHGIFVDADGSIYVGDTENNRVRVIKR
jgi:streptogramin lyase